MVRKKQTDIIKELKDRELIFHLVLTQLILIFVSVVLGLFLFPDAASFFRHFRIDLSVWGYGLVNGIIVVILDSALMKILPKAYYDDGGLNERIFRTRSVPAIIALTAFVAFAEELLFRGMIQTHFGLVWASMIFAAMHIRYWNHWYLIANVLLLSFWVGLVYVFSHENLLAVMVMHFTIDCLLGIRIKKWGV
ncbi:hypothetical protein BpJC7_06150 [Weizmannia acidilactici]|uniref:CAAX prenyl protease 2/Lysostaphin resistance protein A-like domain-containing protein n=1 Tax=Weizmannia acidilactici TaxID=2607726 RepID=A0A5J4J2R7_9BACI|nr:CPBP family intramembrane glutamic endopeptidase [Weizmannia acidilactici]GER66053.1 hypothetical protein BpJC4_05240 [Weizmannia acidilactici]GER69312.1 hypothetical protein BpJC7_06150 [Weizmannia acidilactici]GER72362.1 hypothetical protein BpPP18_04290 [Weizmannia acidilactici]